MTDLTKITAPFGLLDAETQNALEAHGGPYEVFTPVGWMGFSLERAGYWDKANTYRAKPGPKTAREVGWACIDVNDVISRSKSYDECVQDARKCDAEYPRDAPHRIVRLIEWPNNAPLPDLPEGYE